MKKNLEKEIIQREIGIDQPERHTIMALCSTSASVHLS